MTSNKVWPPLTAEDVRREAGCMSHWIDEETYTRCTLCGLTVDEMVKANDIPPCEGEGRLVARAIRQG